MGNGCCPARPNACARSPILWWKQPKPRRKHPQLALATPARKTQLQLTELNENTPERELAALLALLDAGHDMGLMSEAGCPAVADPSAGLVRLAAARAAMWSSR